MMFRLVERYYIAVHEAGHALVSLDLGVPVTEVSIVPDSDSTGRCWHQECRAYTSLDYAIAMAGPFAEALVNQNQTGSRGDIARADEILDGLLESGEWPEDAAEITLRTQVMEEALKKQVERLRPKIEVLAKELLIRQTMTGEEIEEVLRDGT
jgi:ATP-dependent Zn protease